MKFKTVDLHYPLDALAPLMSHDTLEYHWGKHYNGYVAKLNALIENSEYEPLTSLEEIMLCSDGDVYNNAAQAWNHVFFFEQFSPTPKPAPEGDLMLAIGRNFGSLQSFITEFTTAALSLFGSGWVWLAIDQSNDLFIISTQNAKNPATEENLRPLMVIDVWEHAYYLDHQNRRADFIKNFFQLLDWAVIEKRY